MLNVLTAHVWAMWFAKNCIHDKTLLIHDHGTPIIYARKDLDWHFQAEMLTLHLCCVSFHFFNSNSGHAMDNSEIF